MKPLITTIIPTYRRPEKLKKALESVLNQTYPYLCVCVYDNASGDATEEIVLFFAKMDSRVTYHCHPKNIGLKENFNYGLSHVVTPFFSFLSDDDLLLPEFYKTAIEGFSRFPEAGASLGAVIDVEEDGKVIDIALHSWPKQEYFAPPQGLFRMIKKYSNWTGALFRTEAAQQIGTIDLDLEAIDVDFFMRMAARFPLVVSQHPYAVFLQHASSHSHMAGLKLFWPGWLKIIENLKKDDKIPLEVKEKAEKLLHKNLQHSLLSTARSCLENKVFDTAESITKILANYPNHNWKKSCLILFIKLSRNSQLGHRFVLLLFALKTLLKDVGRNFMKKNR